MAPRKAITAPPMITKDLARFLRENLHHIPENDEESRFVSLRVFQIVRGKRGEECASWNVPKKPGDNWPESMALEVYSKVQGEAQVLRGLQKFAVYTYFSHDPESHHSRHLLAIQGGAEDDDDDLETEGPSKEGQVRQLQRHLEAMARVNVSQQMTSVNTLSGLVTKLGDMVENLLDKREKSLELEEQFRNAMHQRELETRLSEKRMDVISDIGKKIGMFVPALANKVAGRNLFPVQGSAVTMMLKGLMGSMMADEKRAMAFMQLLKEEERMVFLQLFEEVGKNPESSGSEGATATENDGQGPS